ncbi:hypothetical protein SPRG_09513 [Saprolegnia parasitica CBS 223.65]|uniref:FAD/NAD(P)-binding domain-containing protein n=1 Tax=Saprolegnia parasitica (strain CBS 223.65) TaxID=695850 RepID=A0A067C2X4_SAPPC|nr:hypothetical protein SPRG_09513 [Saprolegnia parasitica CBS 223.65]KDO24868.1 hypothetical protein SPRG_09513 [Saprolegnia parasitica CBS 223.65]|eukprot:XP_012204329.1 hypothetical protein SPRG_09513 [Saprolegnia parasitica CBS 223.65]
MTSPAPRVVVVGGGYAGIQFAQSLAHYAPGARITVIEKQTFTFHANGMPRAFVDKSYVTKLFIPLDKALPSHVTLVRGLAVSMTDAAVSVRTIDVGGSLADDATELAFDYCILATGSSYAAPIKVPENVYTRETIAASVHAAIDAIAAAESILIVGGGAVGCEVAGEIAVKYPTKTVTLVDGNAQLLANANMSELFRAKVAEGLVAHGVKLVLGERLPSRRTEHSFTHETITLSGGTVVSSDVQLVCAGMTPNTSLLAALYPELVAAQGIKVQASMQLEGKDHIFVLGDASNHPSPKMAYVAMEQAKHLGYGLAQHLLYKTPLAPFAMNPVGLMLLPIGPYAGVAQFPLPFYGPLVLGDWVVRFIKGTDYFASRTWGTWNASVPS